MLTLSLWQPWASAIAVGSKLIETRGWSTRHRGWIAIHAAKRCVDAEMRWFGSQPYWRGAMWPLLREVPPACSLRNNMPFGAVIAVCRLVDCRPSESFTPEELDVPRLPSGMKNRERYVWTERQMGDFTPGRFGFVLEEIRALRVPLHVRGKQGPFQVPDSAIHSMGLEERVA